MNVILESFDFWGNSFTLTVGNSSKQNTLLGSIFGIGYIIVCLFFSWRFGNDLFYRKSPNLLSHIDVDGETKFDFLLSFGYSYYVTNLFNPNRTIDIDVRKKDHEFLKLKKNMERILTVQSAYLDGGFAKEIGMKECNDPKLHLNFGGEHGQLKGLDMSLLTQSTCLDSHSFAMFLYKRNGDKRAKTIEVSVYECANSTENDISNCLSKEKINYYLQNYELRPFYIFAGLIFEPHNYTTPFMFYLETFYSKLIPNSRVTHYLDVQQVRLTTDAGWIVFDNDTRLSQRIEKQSYLVGGNNYQKGIDRVERRIVNQVVFTASKNTLNYRRAYTRVQDIIANVGAVVGIVAFFLQMFLQNIYDSMTREYLIHQIFHIDENTLLESSAKQKFERSISYFNEENDKRVIENGNAAANDSTKIDEIPPGNHSLPNNQQQNYTNFQDHDISNIELKGKLN